MFADLVVCFYFASTFVVLVLRELCGFEVMIVVDLRLIGICLFCCACVYVVSVAVGLLVLFLLLLCFYSLFGWLFM